jgi:hypothetical protein
MEAECIWEDEELMGKFNPPPPLSFPPPPPPTESNELEVRKINKDETMVYVRKRRKDSEVKLEMGSKARVLRAVNTSLLNNKLHKVFMFRKCGDEVMGGGFASNMIFFGVLISFAHTDFKNCSRSEMAYD